MKALIKAYYKLTGKIPRRLPHTKEEFDKMKEILKTTYDLDDTPQVWYTVASQMTATQPSQIKKSYESLANAAKKLTINAVAQDQKILAEADLRAKMEELAKKAAEEAKNEPVDLPEGTPESQQPLP